jgi:hypothetical protein
MAPVIRGAAEVFCRVLAEVEVRETLYMLRGSYGGVLNERGGQEAEISRFLLASNEDVRLFFVSISTVRGPDGARFEGDPL